MLLESVLTFSIPESGTCFQLFVSGNDGMYCTVRVFNLHPLLYQRDGYVSL